MTDAATYWQRLRLKLGTDDDADWRGTQVTPNTLTAVVGGTTSNGVYSISLVGTILKPHGATLDVNTTVSFDRQAAEDDGTIAAALNTALATATINPGSSVTLASQGISAAVNSATITLTFPPEAMITTSSVDPGTATITWPLGQIVPVVASAPHYTRGGESSLNAVVVQVSAMDDAGETLLDPEDGGSDQTFVIEAVELAFVERLINGRRVLQQRIASIETITGALLNTEYVLQLRGARYWTVRLHTFANNITNVDSYEVAWRDAAV